VPEAHEVLVKGLLLRWPLRLILRVLRELPVKLGNMTPGWLGGLVIAGVSELLLLGGGRGGCRLRVDCCPAKASTSSSTAGRSAAGRGSQ